MAKMKLNRKGRKDGKDLLGAGITWLLPICDSRKGADRDILSLNNLCHLCDLCDSISLRSLRPLRFILFAFFAIQFSGMVLAQTLPEAPPILMDNFGPEVREHLQNVLAEVKARPRDPEANGRMGMTLQTYEEYRIAAVYYQRALILQPDDFRWLYYSAVAQAALGNHQKAAEGFKDALRVRPDYLQAHLRLADSLFAAGQLDESHRIYQSLIEKKSGFPQAHYGLGRVLAARRDQTAAVDQFQKAIDLFPGYGMAYYALGMALRDLGEVEKAKVKLALYQQYRLSRAPLSDPLISSIAELNTAGSEILKRGAILESAGQIEQSIAEHERALLVNPRLTQAHINLISLYARTGAFDKAEKHYRDVVAINPNLDDSHYNYGVLLVRQERYKEATEAFLRSLQSNPLNPEAHHNYAVMIEGEGRLDEAAGHYRIAIENKPNHRSAHFHLGRILVNQEKLTEAIEHFLQTLTPEDEETPRYKYALGATYIRAGDREKGILELRGALEMAKRFGQSQLAASLERDLRNLNQIQ